ncbi:hypothetical protein SUGI_0540520 [Cryptomeria japonica]|nr:hypothetical protein SUGI_0540520 [Cryptomeria japonica]
MAKNSVLKYVGILLVCLLFAEPCVGSIFTVWAGPGCTNRSARLTRCGCNNVPGNLHGGYAFVYQGQTASGYNSANCAGLAVIRFDRSTRNCRRFPWRSIHIQC